MKGKSLYAAVALAVASLAAQADTPPQYMITDLGTVAGGQASQGFGISSNGEYVFGRSVSTGTYAGFVWSSGTGRVDWTMASSDPYVTPAGGGVNDHGVAVTGAGTTTFGSNAVPVMWSAGTLTTLNLPSGYTTGRAADINNSGLAVGLVGSGSTQAAVLFNTSTNTSSVISATASDGAHMTAATGINNAGLVVGSGLDTLGNAVGLVYDSTTGMMTQVNYGGSAVTLNGVSEDGWVTGTAGSTPILWSAATGAVSFALPGDANSGTGQSVNSSGWVVGKVGNDEYLYDGSASYSLGSLLVNGEGWNFSSSSANAFGIADNGNIVVTALINGSVHAALLTPVPEPTTWALMLGGLGAIGAIARRRTRVA